MADLLQLRDLSDLGQAEAAKLFLEWLAREDEVLAWGDAVGLDASLLDAGRFTDYQNAFAAVADQVLTGEPPAGLVPFYWEALPATGLTTRLVVTPGGAAWADYVGRRMVKSGTGLGEGARWAPLDLGPGTDGLVRYRPQLVVDTPGVRGIDVLDLALAYTGVPGTPLGRFYARTASERAQVLAARPPLTTQAVADAKAGWQNLRGTVSTRVKDGVTDARAELSGAARTLGDWIAPAGTPAAAAPATSLAQTGLHVVVTPVGDDLSVRVTTDLGDRAGRFVSWLLEQPGVVDVVGTGTGVWTVSGAVEAPDMMAAADVWWSGGPAV